MSSPLLGLKFLLVDLGVIVSCFNIGGLVITLQASSVTERFFFRTCLGLGIWSLVLFFLGVLHLLYPPVLLLLAIASLLISFSRLSNVGKTKIKFDALDICFIALVTFGVCLTFIETLYPPHTLDDTMYHLTSARIYLEHHALVLLRYCHYPVFNEFAEMLFLIMLGLVGELGAQQISWIANVLTMVGIYSCLSAFVDRRAGIIGTAFWLSSALAAKLAPIAFVDIILCLMCLAATYASLCLCLRKNVPKQMPLLIGAFCGFAISTKYTGIIYTVGLIIALLIDWVLHERQSKARLKEVIVISAVSLLASGAWFIRNYFYSHNPVFPFLPGVFGLGGLWSMEDYAGQMYEFGTHIYLNRNPISFFLQMPWYLSFKYRGFGEFQLCYAPLFFVSFYLGFAFLFNRVRSFQIMMTPSLLFLAVWFVTSQSPRYALPALPAFALVFGWSIELLMKRIGFSNLANSGKTVAVCLLSLFLTLTGSFAMAQSEVASYGRIPISDVDRSAFIASQMATYPAYAFLNSACPPGNLYALHDERMSYFYLNGEFMGDYFGPARFSDLMRTIKSSKSLYQKLREMHVNYFLVNQVEKNRMNLPKDVFFQRHFMILLSNRNYELYLMNYER